jgi:hypothetical protein
MNGMSSNRTATIVKLAKLPPLDRRAKHVGVAETPQARVRLPHGVRV